MSCSNGSLSRRQVPPRPVARVLLARSRLPRYASSDRRVVVPDARARPSALRPLWLLGRPVDELFGAPRQGSPLARRSRVGAVRPHVSTLVALLLLPRDVVRPPPPRGVVRPPPPRGVGRRRGVSALLGRRLVGRPRRPYSSKPVVLARSRCARDRPGRGSCAVHRDELPRRARSPSLRFARVGRRRSTRGVGCTFPSSNAVPSSRSRGRTDPSRPVPVVVRAPLRRLLGRRRHRSGVLDARRPHRLDGRPVHLRIVDAPFRRRRRGRLRLNGQPIHHRLVGAPFRRRRRSRCSRILVDRRARLDGRPVHPRIRPSGFPIRRPIDLQTPAASPLRLSVVPLAVLLPNWLGKPRDLARRVVGLMSPLAGESNPPPPPFPQPSPSPRHLQLGHGCPGRPTLEQGGRVGI